MKYITRNIQMNNYADIPVIVKIKNKKFLRSIRGQKSVEDGELYFGVLGYVQNSVISIQIYYDPKDTNNKYLFCVFAKDFNNAIELVALRFSDDDIYLDVQKDEWDT